MDVFINGSRAIFSRGCYRMSHGGSDRPPSSELFRRAREESHVIRGAPWSRDWARLDLSGMTFDPEIEIAPFEMYRNALESRISRMSFLRVGISGTNVRSKATWGHLKAIIKHSEVLSNKIRLVSNSKFNLEKTPMNKCWFNSQISA